MRLLTRADFDGLACGVLLKDMGLMDNWLYVHPKDVQDSKYPGLPDDIVANVPYIPGCGYWFDHHSSEEERLHRDFDFKGASEPEKSAARVIWKYFGGRERFGDKFDVMLHYVDKVDSGDITIEEVEDPQGWVLLGFMMDPRTGLGRYRHFRISNYQLMEELIEYCRTMSAEDILELPDVKERVELYFTQEKLYRKMIKDKARIHGNVLVLDLRDQEEIYPGNRFTMYAMYPKTNVSIQVMWGKQRLNTVFSVGKSIFNRTNKTDIGSLMLQHSGGGHKQVGTCQVPHDKSDQVLQQLIDTLRE